MLIPMTTPALLFPAISLLLLAYTNRFMVLAQLTRTLYSQLDDTNETSMKLQIKELRKRISYIRTMQVFGILAFLFCTITMGSILMDFAMVGFWLLMTSITFLAISLIFSLIEIIHSGRALDLQLQNLENL
jgi:hypothetical protein